MWSVPPVLTVASHGMANCRKRASRVGSCRFGQIGSGAARKARSGGVPRPCTDPRAVGGRVDRYYDPATAEFISVDPLVAETQSPYGYVADDPIDGTDPSGLFFGLPEITSLYHVAKSIYNNDIVQAAKTLYSNFKESNGELESGFKQVYNDVVNDLNQSLGEAEYLAQEFIDFIVDIDGDAAAGATTLSRIGVSSLNGSSSEARTLCTRVAR